MGLKQLLKDFNGVKGDEVKLKEFFQKVAPVVFGGQIVAKTSQTTIEIKPVDIEFYYHEEDGDIKDPIMYHRFPKDEKKRGNDEYRYYEIGQLNMHVSGIDITFEKPGYRASILIRGFLVKENGKDITNRKAKEGYETRSTVLYDAICRNLSIFDNGVNISWIDGTPVDILTTTYRRNVAKYDQEGNKRAAETKINGEIPTENGNYVQDMREYRYISM